MTLEEFVRSGLEVSGKAREAWNIDLYRTLGQDFERRQPVERFIHDARENYPKALRVIRAMLEVAEIADRGDSVHGILESFEAGEFDAE